MSVSRAHVIRHLALQITALAAHEEAVQASIKAALGTVPYPSATPCPLLRPHRRSLRLRPSCATVGPGHRALSWRVRTIFPEPRARCRQPPPVTKRASRRSRTSQPQGSFARGLAAKSSPATPPAHTRLSRCCPTRCARGGTYGSSQRSRLSGSAPSDAFLPEPLFGVRVPRIV